jgi:hypothetical protein
VVVIVIENKRRIMEPSQGRGCKKGQSYTRRTQAEIARDKKREEEKHLAEQECKRKAALNFFAPPPARQRRSEESKEDGPEQDDSSEQPTSLAKNPAQNPAAQNPAPPNPALTPNLDPSADVPFSTAVVPELFRKDVTDAANEI